jgi:hypothetical protein
MVKKMEERGEFDDDIDIPFNTLDSKSTTSTSSDFSKITDTIIEKFEGGYWNPFCENHPKKGMGISTETMFGLDRYNGNIENTPEGKDFFKILDQEKYNRGALSTGTDKNMKWKRMGDFCQKWTWNYNGGDKREILKNLAIKIMKNNFDQNMMNYVSDPKTKSKIETTPALRLHMSYASWNGPKFFKNFAKNLQNAVMTGKSDKELINIAKQDRLSSRLYHQEKVNTEIDKLS